MSIWVRPVVLTQPTIKKSGLGWGTVGLFRSGPIRACLFGPWARQVWNFPMSLSLSSKLLLPPITLSPYITAKPPFSLPTLNPVTPLHTQHPIHIPLFTYHQQCRKITSTRHHPLTTCNGGFNEKSKTLHANQPVVRCRELELWRKERLLCLPRRHPALSTVAQLAGRIRELG